MIIEKDLPFECCENCEQFIVRTNERVFYTDTTSHRVLTVSCKNEWLCKQLKDKLEKDGKIDG